MQVSKYKTGSGITMPVPAFIVIQVEGISDAGHINHNVNRFHESERLL